MKDRIKENQERLTENPDGRVCVFNETDPLKDLVIWGEPGCETILGQLLPEDESLFCKKFDVLEGRSEFKNMQKLLENSGINVIRMKDVIAENPIIDPNMPNTISELSELIKRRGRDFYEFYKDHPDYGVNKEKGEYKGDLRILDYVDQILAEDVLKYHGEEKAIALNWTLCISEDRPMANIMYARDQSNALGDKIIMSRMKREIRQPEVKLFRRGYQLLGYEDKLVDVDGGNFEGGDAFMFGNNCLVGCDVRTNQEGIKRIYKGIKSLLESRGMKLYSVAYDGEERKPGEEMDAMHLDTYMMPLNEDKVLACGEEVDKRRVELVSFNKGDISFKNIGSLRDFLKLIEVEVIDISKEEQMGYSTNFLHLGNNTVVVPLDDEEHRNVNTIMRKLGLDVKVANIKELVGGYGAVHCMTAALLRE